MVFFSLSATVLGQGSTAVIDTSGSTFLWIALLAGLLGQETHNQFCKMQIIQYMAQLLFDFSGQGSRHERKGTTP